MERQKKSTEVREEFESGLTDPRSPAPTAAAALRPPARTMTAPIFPNSLTTSARNLSANLQQIQ